MEISVPILTFVSIIVVIFGCFLFFRPKLVIELQIKFYEKINWRIEPLSMQKEIRNTRIMGLFVIAMMLVIVIYAFIQAF
ncbi:MAG: hypothetical protein ACE5JK_03230 [Candidatus Omnitrophota bacterium]